METLLAALMPLLVQGFPEPKPFPSYDKDLLTNFVLVGAARSAEEICDEDYDLKGLGFSTAYMLQWNETDHVLDKKAVSEAVAFVKDLGRQIGIDHISNEDDCKLFAELITQVNAQNEQMVRDLGLWED